MNDKITEKQWHAYEVVCAERDRYREALELIMDSDGVSSAESMADFARAALDNRS